MRYKVNWLKRELIWRLPWERCRHDNYFRGVARVVCKQRPSIKGVVLDDWTLQTLVLAPAGSSVVVKVSNPKNIQIEATHPTLIRENRKNVVTIKRNLLGWFLYIDWVMFRDDCPEGFGAAAFLRCAQTAKALGFHSIELLAAGGGIYKTGHPWTDVFIGFYTWARFGCDAPLHEETVRRISKVPELKGSTRLLDIMDRDADWWKANGAGGLQTFDLRTDSRSWQTLTNYLRYKGFRK